MEEGLVWRKSKRSNGQTTSTCVELACKPHIVGVRDSKNVEAGALWFAAGPFARFLQVLKADDTP